MTKKLSITLSDYTYDCAFEGGNCINKSARINELMLKGIDSEIQDIQNLKPLIMKQNRLVKDLEEENRRLKLKVGSLKSKLKGGPEWSNKRKMHEAWKRRGLG